MPSNGKSHPSNGHPSGSQGYTTSAQPNGSAGKPANNASSTTFCLSAADQRYLASLEEKLQMVRDRTAGVVEGFSTGFALHGPGGVGKSYGVLAELQRRQANYRLSNSRMTGRGLFDTLYRYPDAVHVLEDVEQAMHDKNAVGVLRSGLWGQRREGSQGPPERWITWSAHRTHMEMLFTGGIILISNRPLLDLPELQALKTRVPCMLLQPSDNELRAQMRQIACRGFMHEGRSMTQQECHEVCDFVIAESLSLHRPLDLRLLVNAFCDYLQWQDCEAGCHWQDLVAARVRERPTTFKFAVSRVSRAERKQQEQQIVREILEVTADRNEQLRLWAERAQKSRSAFDRRKAELKA